MATQTKAHLQPTLWRTCRVLANRQRLEMLRELFKRPDQTVTAVATRLKVTIPLASRYLRELNARGLLKASRVSGWVQYRPCADPLVPQASALLKALRETMEKRPDAVEFIFRNATAWTHPRRGLILHALRDEPLGLSELGRRTGISKPALIRHLRKLKARGLLVATAEGEHALARPPSPLAAVLLRLALMSAC